MGNNAIIIRTVGCHHNGRADIDAEQIAKRCVDELRANGHSILSASVESGGGSIDLTGALGGSQLRGFTATDGKLVPMGPDDKPDSWRLVNPDAPAQAAYERYLSATDGKNFQGNACPPWDALPEQVKQGWRNAVDHTAPRFKVA
jgi:hypothetical protein